MSGRTRMHGGMTVGGAVAAQGGAALLARAQIFTHSAHSRRLACRTVVIAARWVQLASGIGDLSCSWRGGDAPKVPARCYLIMLSSQGFGECLLRCPSNV